MINFAEKYRILLHRIFQLRYEEQIVEVPVPQIVEETVQVPEVQIPARPFLGIDLEDASAIAGIATDWLQKASRGGSNAG